MRGAEQSWNAVGRWRSSVRAVVGAAAAFAILTTSPSGNGIVAPASAGPDAPIVTYTGLRVHEDGSSTVFVDLTHSARVEATHAGKDVSFLILGAKIRTKNNKNPLIAEYFKTNLLRAKLVDEAGGVRLVVQLREAVKTDHGVDLSGQGARLKVNIPPPAKL